MELVEKWSNIFGWDAEIRAERVGCGGTASDPSSLKFTIRGTAQLTVPRKDIQADDLNVNRLMSRLDWAQFPYSFMPLVVIFSVQAAGEEKDTIRALVTGVEALAYGVIELKNMNQGMQDDAHVAQRARAGRALAELSFADGSITLRRTLLEARTASLPIPVELNRESRWKLLEG